MSRDRRTRRRSGSPPDDRPAEFDMTPMIDCTFQLIVFFLVANDLSRKEIVDLALPTALHAEEQPCAPDLAVIVNLLRPPDPADPSSVPRIAVRGRSLDLRELGRELRTRSDLRRPGGPGTPSAVPALIRADKGVPWRHVQWVLQLCADPNVAIQRIQFAATRGEDR